MKRRNWLIATVAAVFVLQAPLCVFACIPGSAPDAEMADSQREASCHEQAATSSENPSGPENSHDDCGCETSYTAVLATPDQTFSTAHNIVAVPPRALVAPLVQVFTRASTVWPSETDLPPPDILLLKSTLII